MVPDLGAITADPVLERGQGHADDLGELGHRHLAVRGEQVEDEDVVDLGVVAAQRGPADAARVVEHELQDLAVQLGRLGDRRGLLRDRATGRRDQGGQGLVQRAADLVCGGPGCAGGLDDRRRGRHEQLEVCEQREGREDETGGQVGRG